MEGDTLAGVFICGRVSIVVGLASYGCATDTVQKQAIAAKAACWKVSEGGKSEFSWDCPKKAEK